MSNFPVKSHIANGHDIIITILFGQALKRKERELEHQLEKLARQKITYQQRLAKLKMEKRLSEDQLPWNRKDESEEEEVEEVERAADDDDQASTSTASGRIALGPDHLWFDRGLMVVS